MERNLIRVRQNFDCSVPPPPRCANPFGGFLSSASFSINNSSINNSSGGKASLPVVPLQTTSGAQTTSLIGPKPDISGLPVLLVPNSSINNSSGKAASLPVPLQTASGAQSSLICTKPDKAAPFPVLHSFQQQANGVFSNAPTKPLSPREIYTQFKEECLRLLDPTSGAAAQGCLGRLRTAVTAILADEMTSPRIPETCALIIQISSHSSGPDDAYRRFNLARLGMDSKSVSQDVRKAFAAARDLAACFDDAAALPALAERLLPPIPPPPAKIKPTSPGKKQYLYQLSANQAAFSKAKTQTSTVAVGCVSSTSPPTVSFNVHVSSNGQVSSSNGDGQRVPSSTPVWQAAPPPPVQFVPVSAPVQFSPVSAPVQFSPVSAPVQFAPAAPPGPLVDGWGDVIEPQPAKVAVGVEVDGWGDPVAPEAPSSLSRVDSWACLHTADNQSIITPCPGGKSQIAAEMNRFERAQRGEPVGDGWNDAPAASRDFSEVRAASFKTPPLPKINLAKLDLPMLKILILKIFPFEAGERVLDSVFDAINKFEEKSSAIKTDLLQLFGRENFALIDAIVARRSILIDQSRKRDARHMWTSVMDAQRLIDSEAQSSAASPPLSSTSKGSGATAKTASARGSFDFSWSSACGSPDHVATVASPKSNKVPLPHVYDDYANVERVPLRVGHDTIPLPKGVQYVENKQMEYEEYIVPPPKLWNEKNIKLKLVRVADLEPCARAAFSGIKTLNCIQSAVFETAYRSDENLLICAPTGAGKTNIAVLCILREVMANMTSSGEVLRDDFKIVYVAPMKALANEIVETLSQRLAHLNISVAEYSGDEQLTRAEVAGVQILVVTPEKWDVATRRPTSESLASLVKLIIFDEVHMLHDERGPVIEVLVARTLRQANSTGGRVRLVGLSATLPNYEDVGQFLRVNPRVGLYFFDGRFRPVPLRQSFIGVKSGNQSEESARMDAVCYEKAHSFLRKHQQVVVFVHTRQGTGRLALALVDKAKERREEHLFLAGNANQYGLAEAAERVARSRNAKLKELFAFGVGIHHAGMLKEDRLLTEWLFAEGHVRVLCCTSTLAWGVNMPAHAVIIRGTDVFSELAGRNVDLGILDVQQIFGRAGRPQFDRDGGHALLITSQHMLAHYLGILTRQQPIESRLKQQLELTDALNAEIAAGTVATVSEATEWLSHTFLFIRMKQNPRFYGIHPDSFQNDPSLLDERRKMVEQSAVDLAKLRMITYLPTRRDSQTNEGYLYPTEFGRTASFFYISHTTMENFDLSKEFGRNLSEAKLLELAAKSSEFSNLRVRKDEADEVAQLSQEAAADPSCEFEPLKSENVCKLFSHQKVVLLLRAHVSQSRLNAFSLISEMNYCVQNAKRVLRAMLELAAQSGNVTVAVKILNLSKALEWRISPSQNALRQFNRRSTEWMIPTNVMQDVEFRKITLEDIRMLSEDNLRARLRHADNAAALQHAAARLPSLTFAVESMRQVGRSLLCVTLAATPNFKFDGRCHETAMLGGFLVWITDGPVGTGRMVHHERLCFRKHEITSREAKRFEFTLYLFDYEISTEFAASISVHSSSENWFGTDQLVTLELDPAKLTPASKLLLLSDSTQINANLPISLLRPADAALFQDRFSDFNVLQSKAFSLIYQGDENALVCAPGASGKSVLAELTLLRHRFARPGMKALYIAHRPCLVSRMLAQLDNLAKSLSCFALSGDAAYDAVSWAKADVLLATPEALDRVWRSPCLTDDLLADVGLIILDDLEILGDIEGSLLEVLISRIKFRMKQSIAEPIRLVAFSVPLANAGEVAAWLGVPEKNVLNFDADTGPVPVVRVVRGCAGFDRISQDRSMNRELFHALMKHSESTQPKRSLVFVPNRGQCYATATALNSMLSASRGSLQNRFLPLPQDEVVRVIRSEVKDERLKTFLWSGIGVYHGGLSASEQAAVLRLFDEKKILVLIVTSVHAWELALSADVVVVKGVEASFDADGTCVSDYSLSDILRMLSRSGRAFVEEAKVGVSVFLVPETQERQYRRLISEPLMLTSGLSACDKLPEYLNAELGSGRIQTWVDGLNYLGQSWFYRCLSHHPMAYDLMETGNAFVLQRLSDLLDASLEQLEADGCVIRSPRSRGTIRQMTTGLLAFQYNVAPATVAMLAERITDASSVLDLLTILTAAAEFAAFQHLQSLDLETIKRISGHFRMPPYASVVGGEVAVVSSEPQAMALFLLQAHFARVALPSRDLIRDKNRALEIAKLVLQPMLYLVMEKGWLRTSLHVIQLSQMCAQALWADQSSLLTLPNISCEMLQHFTYGCSSQKLTCLSEVFSLLSPLEDPKVTLRYCTDCRLSSAQIDEVAETVSRLPQVELSLQLQCVEEPMPRASKPTDIITSSLANQRDFAWTKVAANKPYELIIHVKLLNLAEISKKSLQPARGDAPLFPHAKDAQWVLLLGDCERGALIAARVISSAERSTCLKFVAPESSSTDGRSVYRLFLMSTCYMGLDQQYDIRTTTKDV